MSDSLFIRARFHLAQFLDWGLHSGSLAKAGCHSTYRAVFKNRGRRPRIFAYFNWVLCFASLIYYVCSWGSMNLGIRRPTTKAFQRTFLIIVFLEWILSFGLIYACKKGNNVQCQLWCILETLFILLYLLLTLNVWVEIAWPGLALLAIMCTIKLFGLWLIYYHSLELKSALSGSSRRLHRHKSDQDGMKISYFASSAPTASSKVPIPGKKCVTRRETDQTSIASSGPPSPASSLAHGFEHHHQNGLERRSSSRSLPLPPPNFHHFMDNHSNKFEEPQYSEIMVDRLGQGKKENLFTMELETAPHHPQAHEGLQNQDLITVTPFSNGNIINSGLMCGGSSSINTELGS